jgi:hypothetical protein
MTTKQLAIIDAAIEVAVFSKTHNWPEIYSKEFFELTDKLNQLEIAINAEYPNFNRNVASGKANTSIGDPATYDKA